MEIAATRIWQVDPIHVLGDLGATCNLEPGLAHVVGGDSDRHINRGAGPEGGDAQVCSVVPLLPQIETLGILCRDGATGSAWIILLLPIKVAIGR